MKHTLSSSCKNRPICKPSTRRQIAPAKLASSRLTYLEVRVSSNPTKFLADREKNIIFNSLLIGVMKKSLKAPHLFHLVLLDLLSDDSFLLLVLKSLSILN